MLVTTADLREMDRGMNKSFQNGRGRAEPWHTKVATVVPSRHAADVFPFGARVGKMRKWKGARIKKQLSTYSQVLVNETFEETIEVPVTAWEDDTLGQYLSPMEELGYGAAKMPDNEVKAAIQGGKTLVKSTDTFDGQPFFSATHDLDPAGNQSNLLTSTPLSEANLEIAVLAMRQFTDEVGDIMIPGRLTLVVPPSLELTAKRIVNAALIGNGNGAAVDNVMQNYVDILVLDEFDNEPTTWYLMDLTKGLKPFIWQRRQEATFTGRVAADSDNVFERDQFEWGSRARGVAGYGPWWLAMRCEA